MLTASQSFRLYGIVQRYFNNEEDAQAFVGELETAIDKKYDAEKDRIASKEDLLLLEQKLLKSQADIRIDMKEQKSEMIKWMFAFWLGLLIPMIVFILLYVKK